MKLLVTLAFMLITNIALACKCDGDNTVKSSYKVADVVLVGIIIKIDTTSISE